MFAIRNICCFPQLDIQCVGGDIITLSAATKTDTLIQDPLSVLILFDGCKIVLLLAPPRVHQPQGLFVNSSELDFEKLIAVSDEESNVFVRLGYLDHPIHVSFVRECVLCSSGQIIHAQLGIHYQRSGVTGLQ
ncbi:hypothetical protein C5615_37840 [Burkholderia cepacia]|uniref:Uncharacterized protein n=1 Tax=Burkholderia cepacia TaxID=292 RepID=A0A2S8HY55_BURCE|nr:hypothetical protein C5615_37840 [Burkholderia cepacia]